MEIPTGTTSKKEITSISSDKVISENKKCKMCNKHEDLLSCSRCNTLYCGTEHQITDWKNHKYLCVGTHILKTSCIKMDQVVLMNTHIETDKYVEDIFPIFNKAYSHKKTTFDKKRKQFMTYRYNLPKSSKEIFNDLIVENGSLDIDCGLWCQLALLPTTERVFRLQYPYLAPYTSSECFYIFPEDDISHFLKQHWTPNKGQWVIPSSLFRKGENMYIGLGEDGPEVNTLSGWAKGLTKGLKADLEKSISESKEEIVMIVYKYISINNAFKWSVGGMRNGKECIVESVQINVPSLDI